VHPAPRGHDGPGCMLRAIVARDGADDGGLHNARDFVRSIGSPVASPRAAIRTRGFRGGISSAGWQDSPTTRRTVGKERVRARMADNLSSVPSVTPSALSSAPSSTFRRCLREAGDKPAPLTRISTRYLYVYFSYLLVMGT